MTDNLKKIKPIYIFILLYTVGAIFSIYMSSVYIFDIYKYIDEQKFLLNILCAAGLIFNLFVFKTYNVKKLITHLLLTVFILFAAGKYNSSMFALWLFLLAIPPVNFQKISKTVLTVTAAAVISIVVMTACGAGEVIAFLRPGTNLMRYSYGFLNPTLFAAFLFQICLAFTYIRWKNWQAKDNIFIFAVLCLVFFFTNSRTPSVLIVLLLGFVNLKNILNAKFISYFAESLLILCPILSLGLTKLFCAANQFALALDDFLSYRLRNACYCFANYPVNFWGNHIKVTQDMLLIKNFYLNLLLNYGIGLLILFLGAYALLIKKAAQNKDIALIVILILSLMQGMSETMQAAYYFNYSILAFSALLNNNKLFENNA